MRRLLCVEFDGDKTSLIDYKELSDAYRIETREFLRSSLGLNNSSWDSAKPVNATVKAFDTVGMAMRKEYNYGQPTMIL